MLLEWIVGVTFYGGEVRQLVFDRGQMMGVLHRRTQDQHRVDGDVCVMQHGNWNLWRGLFIYLSIENIESVKTFRVQR